MKIYGEITKIEQQDDGTIKVVGVASTGAVDDADETVLPQAMKAALPGYMKFGALREMHGLSAAGATLSAEVDDDGATRIETHVVDPVAVKKVQLGVYKAASNAIQDADTAFAAFIGPATTTLETGLDAALAGYTKGLSLSFNPLINDTIDKISAAAVAEANAWALKAKAALAPASAAPPASS